MSVRILGEQSEYKEKKNPFEMMKVAVLKGATCHT